MGVIWTARALASLDEIYSFIARDNPETARRWIATLIGRAQVAAETPRAGRMVPEVLNDDVREVFVRTYRILYHVQADAIRVLVVLEGHRRLRAGELSE